MAFVLEDSNSGQPKVWGQTAIDYGRYQVIITKSNRFSKLAGKDVFLPLLLNVPHFEGIRIHTGNWATDSEGCLLVGTGKSKDMVTNSRKAFTKMFDQMKGFLDAGDTVFITIRK